MTSVFSWQNSIILCPASFRITRPNLPVTPGVSWLPTFAFQSPIMKRTSFLGVSSKRSWGQEEKGTTEDEMAGWHHWLDGSLSELRELVMDREAWCAAIHGVTKSRTRLSDWSDLKGLVGLHRTIQLQLLQHYWLGHRLGLLWYWMVCLGNEQRSFYHFWDCIQVLHLGLFVDHDGYSISSEGFLPAVVDIMVIWVKSHPFQSILVHWFLECLHSLLPPHTKFDAYPVNFKHWK